jgi:hypothetical protein
MKGRALSSPELRSREAGMCWLKVLMGCCLRYGGVLRSLTGTPASLRRRNAPPGDLDQPAFRALKDTIALPSFEPVSPQPWSDCMRKLTTALCVALFALSGTASYAADPKKAEPAKPTSAKPADKAASAAR